VDTMFGTGLKPSGSSLRLSPLQCSSPSLRCNEIRAPPPSPFELNEEEKQGQRLPDKVPQQTDRARERKRTCKLLAGAFCGRNWGDGGAARSLPLLLSNNQLRERDEESFGQNAGGECSQVDRGCSPAAIPASCASQD
jgi:hypothetical protein